MTESLPSGGCRACGTRFQVENRTVAEGKYPRLLCRECGDKRREHALIGLQNATEEWDAWEQYEQKQKALEHLRANPPKLDKTPRPHDQPLTLEELRELEAAVFAGCDTCPEVLRAVRELMGLRVLHARLLKAVEALLKKLSTFRVPDWAEEEAVVAAALAEEEGE
jgi:hypothetical protein